MKPWRFILVVFVLLLARSHHAVPQETQTPASKNDVAGKVEMDRGRFLFFSGIGPAENVVVYLEDPAIEPPPALSTRLKMIQRGKRFEPHVVVVTPGTTVDFPNQDPIFHNVFSPYYGPPFDLGLYKPGDSKSVDFKAPGVTWVFCDIHQEMSGIVLTLGTPYFAVTDRQGAFTIRGVPAGTYRLSVWFDEASPDEVAKATRTVEISPSTHQLPLVRLSAQGFVPIPHKNKLGKDYPPPAQDPRYRDL